MSKKFFLILSLLLFAVNLIPEASAEIGVGVGLGQIKVSEVLIPGGIYNLPEIPVINTGDEKTNYSMEISYVLGQGWKNPDKSWFGFNPKTFVLEPERSVTVHPQMTSSPSAEACLPAGRLGVSGARARSSFRLRFISATL